MDNTCADKTYTYLLEYCAFIDASASLNASVCSNTLTPFNITEYSQNKSGVNTLDPNRILFRPSYPELSEVKCHPTPKQYLVITNYKRTHFTAIDKKVHHGIEYLSSISPGELKIGNTGLSFNKWLVAFDINNEPAKYYLYNRETQGASYLMTKKPKLTSYKLSKMNSVEILISEGLKQLCYLSLPTDSDPGNTGRPSYPLPMILFVHGGPWNRDKFKFNKYVQLMTNRGYAVLQCNYRGSTGFGKAFKNAGNWEWGRKMHYDLIDGVTWAINNGVADKSRIAIVGGSYGGYATLVGMTQSPDFFACGVDIVGPSNLVTEIQKIPPYWIKRTKILRQIGGDPETTEGRAFLESRSPLFKAGQIRKPLLIFHGKNDPRVNIRESEQMVHAMKQKNRPVTYIVFPDEGHGFVKLENRVAFIAVFEQFLSRCLGGRAEALNLPSGTTMQVLEQGDLKDMLAEI